MASLPEQIRQQALKQPDVLALSSPEKSLTYRELWQQASALAETVRSLGLSRLGLCGDNSPDWVVADIAFLIAGTVCVPVPAFFSRGQTDHLIREAGLEALVHTEGGISLERLPANLSRNRLPDRTAKITFTSGSTGQPKGVCLSQAQLAATVSALAGRLSGVMLSRHLCVLPLATLLENIAGVYLPLILGSTITVPTLKHLGLSGSSGLDATRLVQALNESRPESLILVPELAAVVVQAAEQGLLSPESFRFIAVGGGKVAAELLARARAVQLPVFEGYGLSECGSVVALNSPGNECAGSVGQPLDHVQVAVDSQGQIRVSGNTHLGYLGESSPPEQLLETGDLGHIDENGFLSVSGRKKNLLITSFGRNISPEWLESELAQLPGVCQALVFGDGEPCPRALLTVTDITALPAIQSSLPELNRRLPDYARLRSLAIRPGPFSVQDGYLTGNGRLRRPKLLADLPRLLSQSIEIQFQQRGNAMSFFDTLQNETAEARAHVMGAPVIGAISEGRFDLASYTWFLTQAFHHVKQTVPLMMTCGGRLPDRLEFIRKALVEYIDEEYGHQEWILNDLQACGIDKEDVRHGRPDTSIELMVAYLYDQIHRGNPAAFFGMVQVLEGTSIELATPLGEAIQKQLGLPDEAFSYLYSHGALDQDHFEFFRNLMDDIADPADQQAIIDSARMVYRLYGDMLRNIPLPAGKEESRHEAA
jgi:long-subunit acyl-CoA synthetase (AMP-forming)/pyrroloquinoline quinone (PQQ) biosynthesis protein C